MLRKTLAFLLAGTSCLVAVETRPLMRDFIGLNGHTIQFKPDLYAPISRIIRDYHPVEWDLGNDTSTLPPWPEAKNRVNWETVYGSWVKKGMKVDVSLMIDNIPIGSWKNMEADAHAYGRSFAREFGPSGNRKLVEAIEIGNEPGKWQDADYTRLLRAMATGIREGDPAIRIVTCNLSTGKSRNYDKSVACIQNSPALFDVLNIHSYAQLEGWPTWRRSHPEDPALTQYLTDIRKLSDWRDEHAPGKPIWLTEFGYDSTTQPNRKNGDFSKWRGVTDEQQAQWLVRSLLVFSTMPLERAYIYFFNDIDEPSLHASSGLTRNFIPKPSYHAVAHLQATLGDYRFHKIVTDEPGKLRVQEYEHATNKNLRIWAVWAPTADGRPQSVTLSSFPGKLLSFSRMPLNTGPPAIEEIRQLPSGAVELQASGSPIYLLINPG